MQELIRRRRRAGFVGRRDELALFRANFDVPVEDERHRFVFHVHGSAGVGKTSLVRELEHVARERRALTATLDESVNSVPEAMTALAAQFARQGHPLKDLDRMLATYRQRRHEAESATTETQEGPSAGSVVAAQAGLIGLGMVPGVGALVGGVDPDRFARGADHLKATLMGRFGKHEDAQLVLDPVEFLTPVLVEELDRIAAQVPWITLFFDTYERTGPFLDPWLRDLITTDRYGELPGRVVVTLSGQRPLDPNCWADCADFITDLPLAPFTDSEARQLLAANGVLDEQIVQDVLRLSGRLPVLVSTLAENPGRVDDPAATAVERFLKWERDPVRRSAALEGALPRRLDEDVFRAAVEGDAAGMFGWVRALPFVVERGGRVQYHDVVRDPMVRLLRTLSPQRWTAGHARLAAAFGGRRAAAGDGVDADERWTLESWREPRLEETYHLLIAQPRAALPDVLRDGVDACHQDPPAAGRWVRTLVDAAEDGDTEWLRAWAGRCQSALDDERPYGIGLLSLLLTRTELDADGRLAAHVARAWAHFRADAYEDALTDYRRALSLDPRSARAYQGRAVTYRAMREYDLALADLDRAEDIAPDRSSAVRERGETYRRAGRYEEAVAVLDRAHALDPDDPVVLGSRGQALFRLGRQREALEDLDRAVELWDGYAWALMRRAHIRSRLGDVNGALEDLDRAERAAPEKAGIAGERGDVYRLAGRHAEAVEQYGEALRLRPGYYWALGSRAMAYEGLGRPDLALADLERALALKSDYTWALEQRQRLLGSH
ncbi:tetratricopeptide repeat protein [Streptomyces sp. NPDC020681]|uniref:tetratricopeptide repeat protein n=1 Tax=Streptomyces sp. NPDC020681 TaxID=3365083 RepID=UPI00379920F8